MRALLPPALDINFTIPYLLTLSHRFLRRLLSETLSKPPCAFLIVNMCIRWCCKHCVDKLTKLTHHWAYERCNEYFIARSEDRTITICPKGPWELRRAYHRHPYRGPQRCDHCKHASRKDKKFQQSARARQNMARGHRSDYNGAIYLGELEIPETMHMRTQPPLEPGKMDAMKAKWENFNLAHRHLASYDLEREWTKRFTASKDVVLKATLSPQTSKLASLAGQRISQRDGEHVSTVLARNVSQNPLQQHIHRHSISNTNERNGNLAQDAYPFVHCNPQSIITRQNSTQETSPITGKQIQPKQDIDLAADTNKRLSIQVNRAAHRTPDHQQQPLHKICSGMTKNSPLTRDSDRMNVQAKLKHSSSSQVKRTRPWDL